MGVSGTDDFPAESAGAIAAARRASAVVPNEFNFSAKVISRPDFSGSIKICSSARVRASHAEDRR